ncbi:hypothetical protein GCM10011581_24740 [Saccharopolyspora subtropica]|uniref:FHA domain-containing protein n=1 Tax=Saccharopolyspora thermophila TaxID=89367 RepID=A0A917JTZ7_9PSEU|nr:FHA domain-containing protein [Saccharopolyspora subtropica]GGI86708.1 hypothetical protein GCM10011581_24740 [Saccharopolyspora subtropica]
MNQTWYRTPAPSKDVTWFEPTSLWTEQSRSPEAGAKSVPPPRAPVEPEARPRLVIHRGPDAGTGFALGTPRVTIGRARDCDIVVDDATVARHHAELRWRDGAYVLEDRGSLTGTYLNRRLVERAELADGDEIWVGKARFLFRAGS